MSDKTKNFAAPNKKTIKNKRPSTVSAASSSRPKTVVAPSVPSSTTMQAKTLSQSKINKNTTIESMPDFKAENREIAYGNILRSMYEECISDKKIEREKNQMDIQMAQLAKRFEDTINVLDKACQQIKDVSFVVEQKRLLDMKNRYSSLFTASDDLNVQNILQNLSNTEQAPIDKLRTSNIDFGFNKDSGHKQLLDVVNGAIEGLEQVKKGSNLDVDKFIGYEQSERILYISFPVQSEERSDLESLEIDFEAKYPKFSENLMKEASERVAKMMEDDD